MSTFVTVLRWIVAVDLIAGALIGVTLIGKPRKPLTSAVVVKVIIFSALVAWLLVTS